LNAAVADYSQDKEGVMSELHAVLDYLGKLKPSANQWPPPTHSARQSVRLKFRA